MNCWIISILPIGGVDENTSGLSHQNRLRCIHRYAQGVYSLDDGKHGICEGIQNQGGGMMLRRMVLAEE